METPEYIKSLHTPTQNRPAGRKVWSIDLNDVLLPYLVSTNANGVTAIPPAAIGAPLRLGYDKAGQVRFSQAGRPTIRIAKEIGDEVKRMRDNFTANLLAYAGRTQKENTDGYNAVVEASKKAGEPIRKYDNTQLSLAIQKRAEAEKAEAEAEKAEAVKQATEAVKVNGKKEKVNA